MEFNPVTEQYEKPQLEAKHEMAFPHRTFHYSPQVAIDDDVFEWESYEEPDLTRKEATAQTANLISSLTRDGLHAPALDIDFSALLVPSRTEGHFHLFLQKTMPWWKYRLLLRVLAFCGIIEKGYYRASVHRRATHLRWDYWEWSQREESKDADIAELMLIRRDLQS